MTVPWRSTAPWLAASVLVVAGAVLLVLGALTGMSASFGWFAYQPLAAQAYYPAGVSLTLTSLIGLLIATLGLIALSFLTGRWIRRRRNDMSQTLTRRGGAVWWAAAALILIGAVLAYPGWSSAPPLLTYDGSYIAFADGWSPAPGDGLLLDGVVLTPAAFFGTLLTLGGLVIAAFLVGLSGAPRRAVPTSTSDA